MLAIRVASSCRARALVGLHLTGSSQARGIWLRASCPCCQAFWMLLLLLPLQGSECTMVCNDFARLGYDYVVVDAGVQLTYDWNLAREMMARE